MFYVDDFAKRERLLKLESSRLQGLRRARGEGEAFGKGYLLSVPRYQAEKAKLSVIRLATASPCRRVTSYRVSLIPSGNSGGGALMQLWCFP
jgi:hypothetical protein